MALATPAAAAAPLLQAAVVTADGPLAIATRFAWFCLLLLLSGALVFRLRVLPEALRSGLSPELTAGVERRAFAVLAFGAGAALLFVAVHPWAGGPLFAREPVASGGWGVAWLVQAAATAALVGGAAAVQPGGRAGGWLVAAGATAVLCAVPALTGHALEADRLRWAAVFVDGAHVAFSGAWLGSLALLLACLPLARRSERPLPEVAALARAFSGVALLAAAGTVATGVARGLFHVQSFPELWRTVYGNTLTFKVGVAAGVLVIGLYNWKRVLPRLGRRGGLGGLRRTAAAELFVAALVLLITAVLVGLPLP